MKIWLFRHLIFFFALNEKLLNTPSPTHISEDLGTSPRNDIPQYDEETLGRTSQRRSKNNEYLPLLINGHRFKLAFNKKEVPLGKEKQKETDPNKMQKAWSPRTEHKKTFHVSFEAVSCSFSVFFNAFFPTQSRLLQILRVTPP